jgi:glutamyl-Q tRNA(Asp) synthetase
MRADASRPVLRFAPSPNGRLHLGHAYSALMNERAATEMVGRLLLRIEDLDRTRSKPEFEASIRNELVWLGIRFESAVRRQSEHADDYTEAFGRLAARGLVYPCFCSRAEVVRFAAGRDPDGAPVYGGACRGLLPEERAARLARGDKVAWRLDAGAALDLVPAPLTWTEFGEGSRAEDRRAEPQIWGDVVLRGRDLAASYHLAVTVDDALQGVSDVVRGRDLLAATSVHRLLQTLLDLPSPRYRHHRLVLDSSGAKLAKSRSSSSLADLRTKGVSASDIRVALGFGGASATRPESGTRLAVAIS